ncbi:MAG: right-handed parallel beta-helix repeat-containing protein [Clostridia bacterium]|nr:right-handed parallel beta-helix repeat-containing protein [Clostridia bacterium]
MKKMTDRKLREVTAARFDIDLNMPKDYPPIEARPTEEGGVRDRFFASVAELPDEITVVRPFNTDAFPMSNANTFFVSPEGDDGNAGTKAAPLGTVAAALERVKGLGGAKIVLMGGDFDLTESLKIGPEHSGTESSPLIITADKGAHPKISASFSVPVSAFRPIPDGDMKKKLKKEAAEHVVCADLRRLGVTDLGSVVERVGKFGTIAGSTLIINNKPQDLARYPNADEDLLNIGDRIYAGGIEGPDDMSAWSSFKGHDPTWEFGLTDERCLDWEWRDDIYLYGALCFEWTRRYAEIGGFDREKKSVRGVRPFDSSPIRKGENNTYFFLNVFEELDAPGEWYLDRSDGTLYLYPPEGGLKEDDDVRFISRPVDLFLIEGAENVLIDNLDAGRCAGSAFIVENCRQVLIQRCHITGTVVGSGRGDSAVVLEGGYRNGLIASLIEHFSTQAAGVAGGDRKNLIPCNNFIQNCTVKNPHNRFGLSSSGGVGNILSHNYLEYTTIMDAGNNECIMEYNVIKGGDTETHDTGMIYVGGGGCSSCANHYRYNYFYDFVKGDYGVYFDDLSRGMYAYGNIVVGNGTIGDGTEWESGGRSYNHHNGGEHCFWNNISIDAGYFAFGGDISYWLCSFGHWKGFFEGIYDAAVEMSNEKYLGRNPTYRDYVKAVFRHHEDLQDPDYVEKSGWAERRLRTPWCNHYENNLIVRAARPFKLDNGEETATGLDTNFITDDDPGFVDFDGRDYGIRPDAPLYKKIPDFIPPPFYKMGTVDDFAGEE